MVLRFSVCRHVPTSALQYSGSGDYVCSQTSVLSRSEQFVTHSSCVVVRTGELSALTVRTDVPATGSLQMRRVVATVLTCNKKKTKLTKCTV
jgi:hypothetical protein